MSEYTTVSYEGLKHLAKIVIQPDGTPHVKAENDADAYFCVGYLHAKNRLFQMDFMRRQGLGRLSEVVGPALLESDKFQREIDIARTAEGEWQVLKTFEETRIVQEAYVAGVNAVMEEYRASGQWPLFFQQLGYTPEPWRPQDSIVCNTVLAQLLSVTEIPVAYSLIAEKFGEETLSKLFPMLPPNQQQPFAQGPFEKLPPQPFPISQEQYFREFQAQANASVEELVAATLDASDVDAGVEFLSRVQNIPFLRDKRDRHSNSWVVSAEKSTTGTPLLASDPHLVLSLPAVWYHLHVEAPNFNITGATIPGIPFVIIGRNDHVAWGVTAGQNASNFFYKEHTDDEHPNQYFWDGAWHDFFSTTTEIEVRGQETLSYTYQSSVHGPIVTRNGAPYALTWMYGIPSRGMVAYHEATKSKNMQEFREWIQLAENTPLNWVCADRDNNIGITTVGRLAMFRDGVKPWLPMSGTGVADIIGIAPKSAMPMATNPDTHMLATSNQRQAGADYPYYLGTATNFDPGYRSNRVYELLAAKDKVSPEDFKEMHYDAGDYLASQIVPKMLTTLTATNELEQKALAVLADWNYQMRASDVAPTLWWTFWTTYLRETFDPWMNPAGLPVAEYNASPIDYLNSVLNQNLEHWTLNEPTHEFFTDPTTGVVRTSPELMQASFAKAVSALQEKLGDDVAKWTWGTVHHRIIASMLGEPSLSYGPVPADGDTFTINVAPGMLATFGASYRMVAVLDNDYTGSGIYPGGQSEDPTTPWYTDRIARWATGDYEIFRTFHEAEQNAENTQRLALHPVK
ncbi:penicillin acylase family protein [Tumebacillus sp. ITR2]|uniref:Penicillin acylase family protein n=1 Tax=Tumebacillus amylolyticus TaxID=2801339 RepID=A0ABS1J4U0_9BACL|nr:penicillin acylase family protein [Tumebacillus amylolyticus]MBL0385292.1 penicillin acylase family protein [Tumebacillus amylolyticus]